MTDFLSEILVNEKIAPDFYRLRFTVPMDAEILPGSFFSLKDELPTGTLLRRPFAFSDAGKGEAEALYQIRGKTTRALSLRKPGSRFQILLPCGNGFPIDKIAARQPVLIAGGVGLGPILFLYRSLSRENREPLLVAGFRSASLIPHSQLPASTVICTDDGSFGVKGSVLDGVREISTKQPLFFACGPTAMMKALAFEAAQRQADVFVSLEAMMGCSLGACMGCVVPICGGGYKRVCKEGPVFDAKEILWTSM